MGDENACMWCLTKEPDLEQTFYEWKLMASPCCGLLICRPCLEIGILEWYDKIKDSKSSIATMHCLGCMMVMGKTTNSYPFENMTEMCLRKCAFIGLFWTQVFKTL